MAAWSSATGDHTLAVGKVGKRTYNAVPHLKTEGKGFGYAQPAV
jgi:hypothetical protein